MKLFLKGEIVVHQIESVTFRFLNGRIEQWFFLK